MKKNFIKWNFDGHFNIKYSIIKKNEMEQTKALLSSKTIWVQLIQIVIGLAIFFSDNFLPEPAFDYSKVIGLLTTIFGASGMLGRKVAKKKLRGIFKVFLLISLAGIGTVNAQDATKIIVPKSVQNEANRTTVFCLHDLSSADILRQQGYVIKAIADITDARERFNLLREYNLPLDATNSEILNEIPDFHSALYRTFYAECESKRDRKKCEKFISSNSLAEFVGTPTVNYPSNFSGIKYVSNRKYKKHLTASPNTNDPENSELYSLEKNGVFDTWAKHPSTKGAGQKVLVVDTPPRFSHLDLRNQFVEKNGKIQAFDPYSGIVGVHDFLSFHGTHTSGTILAEENNGVSITGFTPKSECLEVSGLQKGGVGFSHKIVEGIKWASDIGFDVGSHSYGPGNSQSIANVFALSHSRGQINVVAAGNENKIIENNLHMATLPTVLGVAACDSENRRASFSNQSELLDATNYGVSIMSLDVDSDTDSRKANGTSMACPAAAAVVNACNAVAKQKRGAGLSLDEVKRLVKSSGIPVTGANPNLTPPIFLMNRAVDATIAYLDGSPAPPNPEPPTPPAPPIPAPPTPPTYAKVEIISSGYDRVSGWQIRLQYKIGDTFFIISEKFKSIDSFQLFWEQAENSRSIIYFINPKRFLFQKK